jgi:hypothetical protein
MTAPTTTAQAALLERLRLAVEPLLLAERLPTDFVLTPGVRLRRAYGRCSWKPGQELPTIAVRCTADLDRTQWRREGAIMGTLLHELAHLRYRHHGPRFWGLHRRLVDQAVRAGIYDPADRDPTERGRGDEKLAASAASLVAAAARQARRTRARANRAALQAWQPGAVARIGPSNGRLSGVVVRVLSLGRTRLLVQVADGRRYRVSPSLLVAPSNTAIVPRSAAALMPAPSQK